MYFRVNKDKYVKFDERYMHATLWNNFFFRVSVIYLTCNIHDISNVCPSLNFMPSATCIHYNNFFFVILLLAKLCSFYLFLTISFSFFVHICTLSCNILISFIEQTIFFKCFYSKNNKNLQINKFDWNHNEWKVKEIIKINAKKS